MTTTWWLIISAASFGNIVTLWPLRHLGAWRLADMSLEPSAALLVQAVVLWLAGTSVWGASASFAAGLAAMWLVMKIRQRREGRES